MLVEIISIVKHTSLINIDNIDICKVRSQPLLNHVPKVFCSDRRKQIAQILYEDRNVYQGQTRLLSMTGLLLRSQKAL
jgi:hypothetical protein